MKRGHSGNIAIQLRRLLLSPELHWLGVVFALLVGLTLPMFSFERFYFFNDTFSLISGIYQLYEQGEYLLFVLLFAFSVLLPAIKMFLLYKLIRNPAAISLQGNRYLSFLYCYGKWSMLDVFVVALFIVSVKLGAVANVTVHAGLYVFAFAVLSSMWLTHALVSRSGVSARVAK